MKSWSTIFHGLCIIWLVIRGAFWLCTVFSNESWSTMTFHLLYWLPNSFEFGAFASLPIFYAQLVSDSEKWKRYWQYIKPLYVTLICTICLLQLIWAFFSGLNANCTGLERGVKAVATNGPMTIEIKNKYNDVDDDGFCFKTEYSGALSRVVVSLLFLTLSIVQGIYGSYIADLPSNQYAQYFTSSQEVVNIVNIFLTISFFTRGVYVLLSFFGIAVLPAIPLQGNEDVSCIVLFFFEIWDYLPTILLVLTVTARPIGSPTTWSSYESVQGNKNRHTPNSDGNDEENNGNSNGNGYNNGLCISICNVMFTPCIYMLNIWGFDCFNNSRAYQNTGFQNSTMNDSGENKSIVMNQLDFEIENGSHRQNQYQTNGIQSTHDGVGSNKPSIQGIDSCSSLERFSIPSSLEPPASWLSSSYNPVEKTIISGGDSVQEQKIGGIVQGDTIEDHSSRLMGMTPPAHMNLGEVNNASSNSSGSNNYNNREYGSVGSTDSGNIASVVPPEQASSFTRYQIQMDRQARRNRSNSVEQNLQMPLPKR